MTETSSALFVTVRKNRSYFSWSDAYQFLNFDSVCIEPLGEDAFVMYGGGCIKVYRFGRKLYASATRYSSLRNGVYLLVYLLDRTEGGKYVFRLVRPLQSKA